MAAEGAIGLGASLIALASLFSTCIECFDYYKAAENFDEESDILLVKLDIEKERLLIWGDQAGLLSSDKEGRNHSITIKESLISRALEKIISLLSNAESVQERYGLRISTEAQAKRTTIRALVSRNSMNVFKTAYRRFFSVRNAASLTRPGLISKTVWAIHDKSKFEGLIVDLRDLVDGVYQLIPISRDLQHQTMRADIASILELSNAISNLRLVQSACETSYPVYAGIASTIIETSEAGTIDQQNMEDSLRDRAWSANEMRGEGASSLQLSGSDFTVKIPGMATLFFVVTDACLSHPDDNLCDQITFGENVLKSDLTPYSDDRGRHPVGQIVLKNVSLACFSTIEVNEIFKLKQDHFMQSGDVLGLETRAKFYIYCAPCLRLIHTAYVICSRGKTNDLVDFCIRVDYRLTSTCCDSHDKCERVVSLIDAIKESERSTKNHGFRDCIDRTWMEQRVWEIEEEGAPVARDDDPFTSHISHIFDQSGYVWSETAGIVILGEPEQISAIMASPPFIQKSRMPKATEIYKVLRMSGRSRQLERRFLGTYTRNYTPVVDLPVVRVPGLDLTTPSGLRRHTPPPSVEYSPKRQKTASSVDHGETRSTHEARPTAGVATKRYETI